MYKKTPVFMNGSFRFSLNLFSLFVFAVAAALFCAFFAAALFCFFFTAAAFAVFTAAFFCAFFAAAFAFFAAAFADFFFNLLYLLGSANGAVSSGFADFSAAAFADNNLSQVCQFSLVAGDGSLDLVSLHDVSCDIGSIVFTAAFRCIEQTTDFFVAFAELGFLQLDVYIELCDTGQFVGLLGCGRCSAGNILLDFVKNGHFSMYSFQ